MPRSAAAPYPERSCYMNQNQLDSSYRTLIVCGSKMLRTILGFYMES